MNVELLRRKSYVFTSSKLCFRALKTMFSRGKNYAFVLTVQRYDIATPRIVHIMRTDTLQCDKP